MLPSLALRLARRASPGRPGLLCTGRRGAAQGSKTPRPPSSAATPPSNPSPVNRELSLFRRVELEVQSLQSMKNEEVRRRAQRFVRQNTFTLLISGGVLGAAGAAGAAYLYFSEHPRTVGGLS